MKNGFESSGAFRKVRKPNLAYQAAGQSVAGCRARFGRCIKTAFGLPFLHAALQDSQVVPAGHAQGKSCLC